MGYARPTYPYMEQLKRIFKTYYIMLSDFQDNEYCKYYYDALFSEIENSNDEIRINLYITRMRNNIVECYNPYCRFVEDVKKLEKCNIKVCSKCHQRILLKKYILKKNKSKKWKRQKYLNVTTIQSVKLKYPLLKYD